MSSSTADLLTIKSYAQALFNAAKAQDIVRRLLDECNLLSLILEERPMFHHFLESPQIATDKKRGLVDKAFKDKISPMLLNLLYMMVDRERAALLPEILDGFRETAERAEGIFPATVTSARDLNSEDKTRLKAVLEKFTGCQLKINYQARPDLLGGIIFRFRDILIDGSIRNGLNEIRQRLNEGDGAAA